MDPLGRLRQNTWLAGAVVLLLVVALVLPALAALGLRRWPLLVGAAAGLLLLAGWLERLWLSRPPPRPARRDSSRFKVLRGGKGNGEDVDLTDDEATSKQKWLM
jgi:O-antigen/teichoic acid export membrane protein